MARQRRRSFGAMTFRLVWRSASSAKTPAAQLSESRKPGAILAVWVLYEVCFGQKLQKQAVPAHLSNRRPSIVDVSPRPHDRVLSCQLWLQPRSTDCCWSHCIFRGGTHVFQVPLDCQISEVGQCAMLSPPNVLFMTGRRH